MNLTVQIIWLFLLAIPIACVTWTVTHEEVFREPRDFCAKRCKKGKSFLEKKILLSLYVRILF